MNTPKKESQVSRVLNFLSTKPGMNTITEASARSRYGVQNLRAVMTKIRSQTSKWRSGKWTVETGRTRAGTAKYTLNVQ